MIVTSLVLAELGLSVPEPSALVLRRTLTGLLVTLEDGTTDEATLEDTALEDDSLVGETVTVELIALKETISGEAAREEMTEDSQLGETVATENEHAKVVVVTTADDVTMVGVNFTVGSESDL